MTFSDNRSSCPERFKNFFQIPLKESRKRDSKLYSSISLNMNGMIKAKGSYPPDNELKKGFATEPAFSIGEGKEADPSKDINNCPLKNR